jgi:hypothetical protein
MLSLNNNILLCDSNQDTQDESISINCDSVYKNKDITLKLIPLRSSNDEWGKDYYLYRFTILKKNGDSTIKLLEDTIISTSQIVEFENYNKDKVKDILIQNESSARSNLTFHLYLADSNCTSFKKVEGFDNIPNPNYIDKYDIIDNYVVSGLDWSSFYSIHNYKVIDLHEAVEWRNQNEKEYNKSLRKYNKLLKLVLKKKSTIKDECN